MSTFSQTKTTEMEVTSIRLEKSLKDKLKDLSGSSGYQALIRDILWNHVQQKSGQYRSNFSKADIRITIEATAQKDESCVLTGKVIQAKQPMLLGLTLHGGFVPLSIESLKQQK
jgi:hypothetical protein